MTTRTLTSLLLTISIVLPATPALAYRDPYVSTGKTTSTSAINYVKDHGIMNGYDSGSFGAENRVNRAEFAKIVTEIDNPGNNLQYVTRPSFRDTPSNAWYASYIVYVYQKGWMSGYGDNVFRPDQSVTFAEAAKVLAMVYDIRTATDTTVWYEGPVRALASRHAIPVSIGSVNDALTRGELADIIYRLDTNNTGLASRSYNDVATTSRTYNNTSRYGSDVNCYYDLNNRYTCDDGDYNYDTYYGNNDNNCYYDNNNRRICNNTDDDCYYNVNGRYICDSSNNSNCYYDSNNRYICSDSNTNDNNCYYDSSNRYRCDSSSYNDNNGDCVYDSDGKRVCGGSSYNNNNNCYYDSNNRYRCDSNPTSNNCYYDSSNRYICDNTNNNDDCYYNSNGRYVCDSDNNYNSNYNYNDDNGDCVYDSDGKRVCGGSNYYNDNNNSNCYYDRNNNYRCNNTSTNNNCYYNSSNNYICN